MTARRAASVWHTDQIGALPTPRRVLGFDRCPTCGGRPIRDALTPGINAPEDCTTCDNSGVVPRLADETTDGRG